MSKSSFKSLVAGAFLAIAALPAWSAILSFNPSATNAVVGSTLDVDVVISDLAPGQKLGAFDLLANFNSTLFSFASYTLGNALGIVGTEAFDFSAGDLGGSVHLGEVSFLSDLSAQASSFSLGTLHFLVNSNGIGAFSFDNVTLSDDMGSPIVANLRAASVNAVPEPESLALMLAGLGLLGLRRRRA